MKIKYLPILFVTLISLTSCKHAFYMNTDSPFDESLFTKWVSANREITLIKPGLYGARGFAFVKGQDEVCNYYLGYTHGYLYDAYSPLHIKNQKKELLYDFKMAYLSIEELPSRGFVGITNDEYETRYVFNPEPMKIDEIDLRFFYNVSLYSKDKSHNFYFDKQHAHNAEFDSEKYLYQWYYNKTSSGITLTFGENRTFELKVFDNANNFVITYKYYTGTYVADFESVTLNFEDDQNVFNETSLELFYTYTM